MNRPASTGVGRSGSLPSETMAPVLTRPAEDTRLGPAARPLPQLPVELTASKNLDRRQSRFLLNAGLVILLLLAVWPLPTLVFAMAVTTIVYLSTVAHRVYVTRRSLRATNLIRVSDARARAIPDDELPVYTVLVPAYRRVRGDAQAAREPAGDRVPERQTRREAAPRGRRRRDDRRRAPRRGRSRDRDRPRPTRRSAHEAQGAQLRADDRPRRVRHDLRRRGPPRPAAAPARGLRLPAPAAGDRVPPSGAHVRQHATRT